MFIDSAELQVRNDHAPLLESLKHYLGDAAGHPIADPTKPARRVVLLVEFRARVPMMPGAYFELSQILLL